MKVSGSIENICICHVDPDSRIENNMKPIDLRFDSDVKCNSDCSLHPYYITFVYSLDYRWHKNRCRNHIR